MHATLDSTAAVQAAAATGWRTYVRAPALDEADLFHYTSWIGNGPVIDSFSVSFDYGRDVGSGEGLLFKDQAWLRVHAGISASSRLDRVTLFSGLAPLRVWHPGTNNFAVQEPVLVARNHELWLQAQTVDGRESVSGRLLAEDTRFMMAMCSDNQNSICNLGRPATRYVRDDRELFLAHSYWHTGEAYGQLGAMRDARQLVPRVIETGIIQPVKYFIPTPLLHFADGSYEDHLFSKMRITAASRDFNTVTYTFDAPGARVHSQVALTAFRPEFEGDTAVLVEATSTALQDLALRADGRGIEHVRLAMLPDLAADRRYAWLGTDGAHSGAFIYDAPMNAVTGRLAATGGALLWPSEVGSLLVLPLDGRSYDAAFERLSKGNAREGVTIFSAPGAVARGTTWSNRFLVVLHQGRVDSPESINELRDTYVHPVRHVLRVERGVVAEDGYPLRFHAEGGAVAARLESLHRHDPLPAVVDGLPGSGSTLVASGTDLQVAEAIGGTLHFTVPPGLPDTRIAVGRPLLVDDQSLAIEWAGVHAGGLRFHVHNPAGERRSFRIASNAALPIPNVEGQWELGPGESAWLWARS